jgi:hypothetical protein
MVEIPVRHKGKVAGFALVDDADASKVTPYRWRLDGGYAVRSVYIPGGRHSSVQMHRVILGLGAWDRVNEVDHQNHNKLDNQRGNLRVVSRSVNQHNRIGPNVRASALPLGVYAVPALNKFKAEITVEGERHYLGLFFTSAAAECAVVAFRRARGLSLIDVAA